jgi:hypothetical protein
MSLRCIVTQADGNEVSKMGEYAAFNSYDEDVRPLPRRIGE